MIGYKRAGLERELLTTSHCSSAVACNTMKIPQGFSATLCSFLSFLPFFLLLFLLGFVKGFLICIIAFVIVTIGNGAVVLGLWPAHAIWTFICLIRAEHLGPILKILLCLCLPLPLLLWLPLGIGGSMLGGIAYGFLTPLIATFDAIGESHENKFRDCFLDGTWSTIKGSCTIVRDFTDVCFHTYFSYMDDLRCQQPKNTQLTDIRLLLLPACLLSGLIGIILDVPMILLIALWKSPIMLFKGWHQLVRDLIGREGPFLETVCVPFAGLAILLWPLAVGLALFAGFISSFFLGLYAAVVVYKESSLKCGLAYIVSVISLFDEYTNDLLYLREGSCFPRPNYSKTSIPLSGTISRRYSFNYEKRNSIRHGHESLGARRMGSLRQNIQKLGAMQVWDYFFESFETNGKALWLDHLILASDIEEWMRSGKCDILVVGLPAYCLLQNLLRSAKSGTDGFIFADGTQITSANRPDGLLFEWFFEPLLVIKEQIRADHLDEDEELYLSGLVLFKGFPDRLKSWQSGRNPPTDDLRKAELEALCRRLQGIARSISRMPTFRRRFQCVMKALLQVTLEEENVLDRRQELFKERSISDSGISFKNKLVKLFSQKSGKRSESVLERSIPEEIDGRCNSESV